MNINRILSQQFFYKVLGEARLANYSKSMAETVIQGDSAVLSNNYFIISHPAIIITHVMYNIA